MRIVIQRVASASVTIGEEIRSAIGLGLLILLGIGHEDSSEDIDWLVRKVAGLRIFNDGPVTMGEIPGNITLLDSLRD